MQDEAFLFVGRRCWMDLQQVTRAQQLAALKMLKEVILKCPPDVWDAPEDSDAFWFKAHHTLYWAHLHLRATRRGFGRWKGHRRPRADTPTSKTELIAYAEFIEGQLLSADVTLRREKLEQEIADIRHIQQHTGELFERLGSRKGTILHWTEHVRRKPK
jgi:hypothetical protein